MCDCHTDSELLTQFHEHGNMKMKDWKEYRLGEMIQCNPQVKLEKGKSYTLIDIDSIEIGSRYVKGKELTEYDGQSGCHFQNGDTVMARITPCLENGKIAQVQCESQKGFGSTELFVFRGMENKTDSNYVFNLMSMQFIRDLAANSMTGASGRQRADLGFIKRIKWNFPPLPTQQKIASILSAYDDLIQNYKKQIEALQTAASELYKEWFVRFRFPGWQNAKFENGIPEGWSICRLKDFGKVITGKTPPTEKEEYYGGDVMFVKTPDMHGNMFVQSTSEYLSKLGCEYQKAQYLPENSIMVSCIGTGGITAINAYPANTNQQINSIILKDKKYLPWLYFTISNMKETIEMFGNTGTTMTNLSKGKFEKLKVVKPEHSIIQTFENKVSPLFEQIKNLNKQITNLTQQRDLLLPRLMSDKLEVLK